MQHCFFPNTIEESSPNRTKFDSVEATFLNVFFLYLFNLKETSMLYLY